MINADQMSLIFLDIKKNKPLNKINTYGLTQRKITLLVATEQLFRTQFNIDERTNCEAVEISTPEKMITLKDIKTSKLTIEKYDKLVLSPGAVSVMPPLPGIDFWESFM